MARPARLPRRALAAAALACLVLAVPGCARSAAPGPTTATTRGAGEVTGDWEGVKAFANAVLAEDVAAAERYVVPGSPAARYLAYTADLAAAGPAHERPSPGSWLVSVDPHLGAVTLVVQGGSHVTWTDWRFAADGRILQWSTPTAGALETRLWTTDARADSPAGTVALASALVNDATLTVVLDVHAAGTALVPDCSATYAWASGSAGPTCLGPASIPAGGSATVALQFPGAPLGGTLSYALADAGGRRLATLSLPVA